MGPDDKICYCYNVSYRKLYNYARRHKLARPSQLSECLGAGTGCGWCIPILKRIHAAATQPEGDAAVVELTADEYAQARQDYIREKKPRHTFD